VYAALCTCILSSTVQKKTDVHEKFLIYKLIINILTNSQAYHINSILVEIVQYLICHSRPYTCPGMIKLEHGLYQSSFIPCRKITVQCIKAGWTYKIHLL